MGMCSCRSCLLVQWIFHLHLVHSLTVVFTVVFLAHTALPLLPLIFPLSLSLSLSGLFLSLVRDHSKHRSTQSSSTVPSLICSQSERTQTWALCGRPGSFAAPPRLAGLGGCSGFVYPTSWERSHHAG